MAQHLGSVSRAFQNGSLKEENISNADETHFIVDMDNGRTHSFQGHATSSMVMWSQGERE